MELSTYWVCDMIDALKDEISVDDNSSGEDTSIHIEFEIASYPSDLTLSVIHDMWKNDDISIPLFQRNFVWNIRQSSQLIESFLLGLPIPQVFFYVDTDHKNLVIDGQQRILSVIFFFEGYFGFENLQGRRTVFRLSGLSEKSPYLGKRFEDLSLNDQRRLRGSVLRAVNIRQLAPENNSTSIYHIFERLNTGGTPLRAQEIRNCVFHGTIVGQLQKLNSLPVWRAILGKRALDKHQRDVEMILRIFAIAERGNSYEKPMREFLNQQMKRHASDKFGKFEEFSRNFQRATDIIHRRFPQKPFHIRGPINLAAMDSTLGVMISNIDNIPDDIYDRYVELLKDQEYRQSIYYNTSDAVTVKDRLRLAKHYLIQR